MAHASNRKVFVATILVMTLVVVHGVTAIEAMTNDGGSGSANSTKIIECGGACAERCKLSRRPNLCQRACTSCCRVCDCVPPGTSGNYQACPCYAKLTTRDNKPKCP